MKLKTLFTILIMTVTPLTAVMTACRDNEPWGELPEEISEFINQYFPNSGIEDFSESATTYHVRIISGPGLTFGKDCKWEAISGYGMPLPQVLLFDQLPPALYNYLDETENLDNVFGLERDRAHYPVVLLADTLTYDISTQQITGATDVRA